MWRLKAHKQWFHGYQNTATLVCMRRVSATCRDKTNNHQSWVYFVNLLSYSFKLECTAANLDLMLEAQLVLYVYYTHNKAFTICWLEKRKLHLDLSPPFFFSVFLLLCSLRVGLCDRFVLLPSHVPPTSAVNAPILLNWQPQLCRVNNVSYACCRHESTERSDPFPPKNTYFIYPNTHFLIVLLFCCFAISYFKFWQRISDVWCYVHVVEKERCPC